MPKRFYPEVWRNGPVSTEVWRLAAEDIRKTNPQKWDRSSDKEKRNAVIAYLWVEGVQEVMIKRAKYTLSYKRIV